MHLADLVKDVVGRSIIVCAARPSSASRYKRGAPESTNISQILPAGGLRKSPNVQPAGLQQNPLQLRVAASSRVQSVGVAPKKKQKKNLSRRAPSETRRRS